MLRGGTRRLNCEKVRWYSYNPARHSCIVHSMAYESNIVRNGSEDASHKPGSVTGPFSRREIDLSVGANTTVALAGFPDFPAKARALLLRRGDAQRSTLDSRNSRGSISLRRALMRRYCPNCRPNQQNTPESIAVERMQAALGIQSTFPHLRWPPLGAKP